MTLRVSVKNEDSAGRVLQVQEQTFRIGYPTPENERKHRLQSGESLDFHVHAGKQIVLTEDPDSLL